MKNSNDFYYVPTHWSNFIYDFPQFVSREKLDLRAIYGNNISHKVNVIPQQPLALIRQSHNTQDAYVPIPEELLEYYYQYRPTPLKRANGLEAHLKVNARIYYKFEGANLSGSHKLNTALAQAYYYKKAGIKHLVTGTGAGQWGTAIAYACQIMNLECTVFMVGVSLRQKPYRKTMMELFGATVHESPSELTKVGRDALKIDKERIGSLAFATGEAIEYAQVNSDCRFAVGSGENCVLLHQSIIGCEAVAQMHTLDDFPTDVVACMGAGSNFGGVGLPFLRFAKELGKSTRLLAVEPSACPKLTRGVYAYDKNDFSGTTPISKMYTLGSKYMAPPIYAGGLRYHGTSPFLSAMYHDDLFDALAIDQPETLAAGLLLARTENILPAPESAHAVAGAIRLAKDHPHDSEPLVILINVSGHGMFDVTSYEKFQKGEVESGRPSENSLKTSLQEVGKFNELVKVTKAETKIK